MGWKYPRLRRRLVRTPPGCGRPIWVDDPAFSLERHLTAATRRDDRALLDLAAAILCRPLPRDRPRWSACWVSGLPDDRAALVLALHHVVADGVGGLAVLGALTDEGADGPARPAPWSATRPRPRDLAAEAWRDRAAALRHPVAPLERAVAGLRELGADTRPRAAPPTRYNRPTGARRRLTTVAMDLAPVADAAHRHGTTVTAIVLGAVVGAMAGALEDAPADASVDAPRDARPSELVVSVPVTGRPAASGGELGNQVGVIPLRLPTTRDRGARVAAIAALLRERRARAPAATSAAPLGVAFRALARVGLFRPFVEHQRLVNTVVTNVRGPERTFSFTGHRVTEVIPMAVNPGNLGVTFDVLSYAGRLVVTVVADPEVVPDQDVLTGLLRAELAAPPVP